MLQSYMFVRCYVIIIYIILCRVTKLQASTGSCKVREEVQSSGNRAYAVCKLPAFSSRLEHLAKFIIAIMGKQSSWCMVAIACGTEQHVRMRRVASLRGGDAAGQRLGRVDDATVLALSTSGI